MKIARIAILIAFCFHFAICMAQQDAQFFERYHLSHYTDENGLPQNSVKSITVDNLGFIWLTTEHGLVRYDGQQFHTYNNANSGITSLRFYGFQHDVHGNRNRQYTFPPDNSGEALRIENGIAVLDTMHSQTVTDKLIDFDGQRGPPRFMGGGLPGTSLGRISSPIVEYTIQCASGAGSFFEIWRGKVRYYANWKLKWELPSENTHFERYFGVKNDLFRFSDSGTIQQITSGGIREMEIEGDLQHDPAYLREKNNFRIFWNNTSGQVFVLINKKFYLLQNSAGKKWSSSLILDGFDFDSNNICTVHFDTRDKRIFLGSTTRGLFVIVPKQFRTIQISDRDEDNIMYAQAFYGHDKVVVPSGFVLGVEKTGEIYKQKLPAVYAMAGFDRRGILTDASGNIWSKMSHEIRKFSPDGRKLLAMWNFGDEIRTIFKSDDGRIWAGMKDSGLFYVRDLGSVLKPESFLKKTLKRVIVLLHAGPDSLWMGTESGLYRLSLKTGETKLVPDTEKFVIRSLKVLSDLKDGVFFTTYNEGIFLYQGGKLTSFPLDEKHNLSAAHCITEDRKGFFWITANKGLFQFSIADLIAYSHLTVEARKQRGNPFYLYYTKESGFSTNEFNGGCQPCAVSLSNGEVSLPSLNGLVWFVPDKIRQQLPDGSIVIDQVVENGAARAIFKDSIAFGLSPKQISLHVTTPYFGNQANIQLSYALTRGDKPPVSSDWVLLEVSDPVIRFSELSSGDYTLAVRKVNGFGANNYATKRITLIVPKEWFETAWFRVLCLLALGLCIYAYIKLRTAFLQKKNEILEEQVLSRTQRLEIALGALKSSEMERSKQMHIQTQLVASISHDIRTPLRYILNLSERVEDLIKKGELAMVAGISENVVTSAKRMYNLLENMLAYIRTQVHHEPIKMQNVSLRALVYEKASVFTSIIAEQDNRFRNDVPGTYHVSSNSQLLGVVIHNLIDNANKYTFDGTLQAYTEIHIPYLHLVIADNGPGMPPHIINWFNNTPDTEQEDSPIEEKKGLGLFIVKEIANLIDVRLKVENSNGTRVHIIFDMADQVLVGAPLHGTLDEGLGLEVVSE